jgi:hypothetical protein
MSGPGPSHEREYSLLIVSAGTAERRERERERAAELAETADWSLLADLLRAGRLLPTLGPRLIELVGDRSDGSFTAAVEEAVGAGQLQDALLLMIGERLHGALGEAGIRAAELKGPRLGAELHGEAGRRLSSDIDVLVEPGQLAAAVEVARSLGYAPPSDHVEANGLPLLHFTLEHEQGELPPVELHWRVHWYEPRFAAERLLPASAGSAVEWRPAPADELAALLLFYARDGFTGLRQATDVSAWWDRHGEELAAGELDEIAAAYPELARALAVASRVAARTVGLPPGLLAAGRALDSKESLALRLANPWPYASSQQLYAEIGLIDGLLAPPGGLSAFFRRQVAPPRAVLREHAERAMDGRVNTTLGYSVRVLGRYGLALGRLAHRPHV